MSIANALVKRNEASFTHLSPQAERSSGAGHTYNAMDLPKISVTEFKEHGVPLERPVEDIPATNEPAPDDLDAELQKHTDHAENGATILMLAHSCRDLLETCVNHSEKNEFVLLRERFLSWASSIDVFSMQSELDVTLRKKPHIHDIFVRFLLVLEQGLKQRKDTIIPNMRC